MIVYAILAEICEGNVVCIFKCNDKIKSYKYPIIKIISCAVLILLLGERKHFINIDNLALDIIERILAFQLGIAAILCIYISITEMVLLHERREKSKIDPKIAIKRSVEYSLDDILSLLLENDIIKITAISNNQIVEIGSASDFDKGSSKFFDKSYYVNENEIKTFDDFKAEIEGRFTDGKISVIAIDDMPPK